MRRILAFALFTAPMLLMPLNADTFTYTFTSDHCTGGCLPTGTNGGTITVTDVSPGVVSVQVQLASGFGFVDTGAGAGASFFFRLLPTLGGPTITYSNVTAGWSIPNVIGTNQQAAGSYAGDGLSGEFEYALACSNGVNPPPDACGNGGSSPAPSPLNFTISAAGITAASFNDPGASGSPFAADVISSNGRTGLIDASLCTDCTPGTSTGGEVPEPASVFLLGSVFIGVAAVFRKKARQNT